MAYVNAACTAHVTIFSTGSKFCPVSNFTWLHGLTLAAHSYALLYIVTCLVDSSCTVLLQRVRGMTLATKLSRLFGSNHTPFYLKSVSSMLHPTSRARTERYLLKVVPTVLYRCSLLSTEGKRVRGRNYTCMARPTSHSKYDSPWELLLALACTEEHWAIFWICSTERPCTKWID